MEGRGRVAVLHDSPDATLNVQCSALGVPCKREGQSSEVLPLVSGLQVKHGRGPKYPTGEEYVKA